MFVHIILSVLVFGNLVLPGQGQERKTAPHIPLQSSDPGTPYSEDPATLQAPVRLEVFLDVNCRASQYSMTQLPALQAHYGALRLNLVIYHVPLPYHVNAFVGTQGFYLIKDKVGGAAALRYVDQIFTHIADYDETATYDKTRNDIIAMYAEDSAAVAGVNQTTFISNIDTYRWPTAYKWKYGTRRLVAGTPWFFLNGVDVNARTDLTTADWIEVIDPMMAANPTPQPTTTVTSGASPRIVMTTYTAFAMILVTKFFLV